MNVPLKGEKITFCTKVLCFKGLVKNIDIEKEDVYKEISEDIRM